MSPEKIELIKGLYQKGDEDILIAEIIIDVNPVLYDIVAFHAQQCAEKYMKAFIVYTENLPPKIHDLRVLINLASVFDSSFEEIKMGGIINKVCYTFALSG